MLKKEISKQGTNTLLNILGFSLGVVPELILLYFAMRFIPYRENTLSNEFIWAIFFVVVLPLLLLFLVGFLHDRLVKKKVLGFNFFSLWFLGFMFAIGFSCLVLFLGFVQVA